MSILKTCYYLFFSAAWCGFFRWTIQAQSHFWPWHACLSQALHERSDPQSVREDAYSLTRRNYQERPEPLVLGINGQAENWIQKCSRSAWLCMTATFLFQTIVRTLQFGFFFIVLCIFLMLWLNTALLSALRAAAFRSWWEALLDFRPLGGAELCDGRIGSGKLGCLACFLGWLVTGSQQQTPKHSCVAWCGLYCEKQHCRELR